MELQGPEEVQGSSKLGKASYIDWDEKFDKTVHDDLAPQRLLENLERICLGLKYEGGKDAFLRPLYSCIEGKKSNWMVRTERGRSGLPMRDEMATSPVKSPSIYATIKKSKCCITGIRNLRLNSGDCVIMFRLFFSSVLFCFWIRQPLSNSFTTMFFYILLFFLFINLFLAFFFVLLCLFCSDEGMETMYTEVPTGDVSHNRRSNI